MGTPHFDFMNIHHLDVYFHIVSEDESGDETESLVEGLVPAHLLDRSKNTDREIADVLLYELQSPSRQNSDLSGVESIDAVIEGDPSKIDGDPPDTVLINRVDGEWRTSDWVPVPGYEPSETPLGRPSPGASAEEA